MSYQITDSNGVTRLNPEHRTMLSVLQDLRKRHRDENDTFPEAILTHESGWAISVTRKGTVVLEIPDDPDSIYVLKKLDTDEVINLWQQLAMGNLDRIRALPWTKTTGG
ncbi:MAG: hypothetical protein BWY82_00809 [Verrucomicrobia bacterium ADurb.Bin474]|mgnify:FL=1|nr:MAG: hypothetical protein BWY82_00809 [Verrucomicrobia bacterium ADurb.Bin474]